MTDFPPGSNLLINGDSEHWLCLDRPAEDSLNESPVKESPIRDIGNQTESENGESTSDNSWEFIGEDLKINVPVEHTKRLASLFPGVKEFPHAASVYGGECTMCGDRLTPDDATLDFYDGNFYCSNCHQEQEAVIPRDVIECWDFTLKPVSFASKKFLDSVAPYPLLNIALINPSLFSCVPEMASLRRLRRTLSLFWSLISRCSKEASYNMAKFLRHRSYMLDSIANIDKYSIRDLLDVPNGVLEEVIQTAVDKFAMTHVNACTGCLKWVSFCDICRDQSRPIWPYAFANFRRCSTPGCRRAMHFDCLLKIKDEFPSSTTELFRTINIESDDGTSGRSSETQLSMEGIELLPHCTACRNNLRISKPNNLIC
nr:Pleckstriny domain containing family M [Hymenolepis microstoma]